MIIDVRKLKIKTSASMIKKIPFDVIYIIKEKHKEHIPKFLRASFIVKPDEELIKDINELPIRHVEFHGMTRKSERKITHAEDKGVTFKDHYKGITEEDLLIVPVLTRLVRGEPRPSYFVNKRVRTKLDEKHRHMRNYSMALNGGRDTKIVSQLEFQLNGKYFSPCGICSQGLLKSLNWQHCSLGTNSCLTSIMLSKKESFSYKQKQGTIPADYQEATEEPEVKVGGANVS